MDCEELIFPHVDLGIEYGMSDVSTVCRWFKTVSLTVPYLNSYIRGESAAWVLVHVGIRQFYPSQEV